MTHSTSSARHAGRAPALLDSAGFRAAVIGSFTKLAPQHAFKNPVMAVVWLGTLLTAGLTLAGTTTPGIGWSVTALLFVTVLFANFAEAVAEARGRGQAASLRRARKDLVARRVDTPLGGSERRLPAAELKPDDYVIVSAGEQIPADGEIVKGLATINESAVTGESAPVLREAGTDRSGVIGGTKVLEVPAELRPLLQEFPYRLWRWIYASATDGDDLYSTDARPKGGRVSRFFRELFS